MRRPTTTLALSGLLIATAGFAAAAPKEPPKETPEATATRVQELEKADVVIQEDLARLRLQLDLAREALDKARADLAAETAARKDLEARLAAAQQQTAREITAATETTRQTLTEAMEQKLAALTKTVDALATRHEAELAALRKDYDAKVASLQAALAEEREARLALGESTDLKLATLEKRQKNDRKLGWILNGLTLGVAVGR
ncbi:MAG: hypothetical protein GX774_22620 [Armatimonadetes bacterium]|jgi:chromosome segregation ATPase|nr:hypothetical protein [Armatimonadota bacterium]